MKHKVPFFANIIKNLSKWKGADPVLWIIQFSLRKHFFVKFHLLSQFDKIRDAWESVKLVIVRVTAGIVITVTQLLVGHQAW